MNHKNNLDHKVGIRLLDGVTLENVFPMYENLNNKLAECRRAAQYRMKNNDGHYHAQYNLMYDNVFSILGTRGTGKTSVAFTLREKIMRDEKHPDDVVLPIIIPEVIPDNCSILGWILAIVKEEVEKLQKELAGHPKEKEDYYWRNCGYQEGTGKEALVKRLGELRQYLFAGDYDPSNEKSYYAAIDNMAAASESNYQFANKLAELWDMWIRTLTGEGRDGTSPLIFFIFDDVDLAPERIGELLSVITKYLAHPNIVVIATADEKLLLDVMERRLDKSIGHLPREWRTYLQEHSGVGEYGIWLEEGSERKQKDSSKEMARMYLGKVLPPSTRYYLQLFQKPSQKADFWLDETKNLGMGISDQLLGLAGSETEKAQDCFIANGKNVISFYVSFFGNTCRQINNVYIGVKELIRNLKAYSDCRNKDRTPEGQKRYLDRVYKSCRYFLEVALHCNQEMNNMIEEEGESMDIDHFLDMVFLPEYRRWRLYIHYDHLNDFLMKYKKREVKDVIETGLQYYALFAFMENILLMMEEKTKSGLTGRKRVNAVRPLVEFLSKNVFVNRHIFREDLPADAFFRQYDLFLERIPAIIENGDTDRNLDAEYFYNVAVYSNKEEELHAMYRKNRRWFLEITKMLARMYGNTYLITGELLKECIPFTDRLRRWSYQSYVSGFIRDKIVDCTKEFDLYGYAKQVLKKECAEKHRNTDKEYKAYLNELREVLLAGKEKKEDGREQGNYLSMKQFLDYAQSRMTGGDGLFAHCPEEIYNDMEKLRRCSMHVEEVRNMIGKYVSYIEQSRYPVNYMCISDVTEWFQRFQEVRRSGLLSIRREIEQIEAILAPVFGDMEMSDEQIVQLIFGIEGDEYEKFRDLFQIIMEKLDRKAGDEEEKKLREKVRILAEELDVVLVLDDPGMYRWAADMAVYMLVVSYLTEIYICLSIRDGYETGNYLSSKRLEQTDYYSLFGKMKSLLEMEVEPGKENLAYVIRENTLQQRRTYIERLLEES